MRTKWTNILSLRIPWGVCDPAGVVHFSQWFRWFDLGTWTYFERAGLSIPDQMKRFGTLGLPIVGIEAAAKAPARAHEELKIATTIGAWHRKVIDMHHVMRRDETVVFEGRETRAWVVRDGTRKSGIRAETIPAEVVAHFERLDRQGRAG